MMSYYQDLIEKQAIYRRLKEEQDNLNRKLQLQNEIKSSKWAIENTSKDEVSNDTAEISNIPDTSPNTSSSQPQILSQQSSQQQIQSIQNNNRIPSTSSLSGNKNENKNVVSPN